MGVNLTPTSFIEYFTGLPLRWYVGNSVGQANANALGYFWDNQIYQLQQAVQARFPLYAPQDAYGYLSEERGIIKGYLDGYNAGVDGYLFPPRLQAAWQQWQFGGTALGLLLQLHYQGVDGYIVQQNGLGFGLNTAVVNYSCNPPNKLILTCTTGGFLGTAVFSYVMGALSGSITTANINPDTFLIPGSQTLLYFPQQNYIQNAAYVVDTNGNISYWEGAIPGPIQLTSPENALVQVIMDPNPNLEQISGSAPSCGYPAVPITIQISTGGVLGTMKFEYKYAALSYSAQINSSGNQFEYLIPGTQTRVLFYAGSYILNATYVLNVDGTITNTGGGPTIYQYSTPWFTFDPSNPEPWSRFLFICDPVPAWWNNIQAVPNNYTVPNATTINNLINIINQWKPAKSTCTGIVVPVAGNLWGWPPDRDWNSGLTWGSATPNVITYHLDGTYYLAQTT